MLLLQHKLGFKRSFWEHIYGAKQGILKSHMVWQWLVFLMPLCACQAYEGSLHILHREWAFEISQLLKGHHDVLLHFSLAF